MTQKKKNADSLPKGAVPMDYLTLALQQRDVEGKDHVRFLKAKADKYFRDSAFWQSPLPTIHLKAVLDSDLQAPFFTELFSKKENVNPAFLEYLASENPDLFQKYFKLTYTHRIPEFQEALKTIAQKLKILWPFSQEIEWITAYETKLDEAREKRRLHFLQFPPDQVIFAFLLLHQEIKISPAVLNNRGEKVSEEVAIFQELNRLLHAFAEKGGDIVTASHYTRQQQIERDWHYFAAKRMHESAREVIIPLPPEYGFLNILVKEAHDSSYRYSTIQRYLAGFGTLEMTPHGVPLLKENEANRRFEYDNRKATYEDMYFLNKTGFVEKQMECMAKGNANDIFKFTDHCMARLQMNGEPDALQQTGNTILLDKCFQLLQLFARFKGPEQRQYIQAGKEVMKTVMNEGPEYFRKELGPNEYLSVYDAPSFQDKIAKVFGWSIAESKTIIDFLTWDIAAPTPPEHWLHRPLLKIGNKIFWVGAMLAERNWVYGIQMRLRTREFGPQFVNDLSVAFEQKIMHSFQNAGFAVLQGKRFTNQSGASGDLDVVAYKGNCLFIAEAKNTLVEEGFVENTFVETVRFDAKAAFQLDKCIEYANESKADLLALMGIDLTQCRNLEDIKVYPLIVSRAFEGDQMSFRSHQKVSYLELEIILKNELDHLFGKGMSDHRHYHGMYNRDNPHFDPKPKEEARDLWQGQKSPTPDTIIQCIEEGRVWKEFHETWNY